VIMLHERWADQCVRSHALSDKDYLLINIDRVTTVTFHGHFVSSCSE